MAERWVRYRNMFYVSDCGRIRTLELHKLIRTVPDKTGYKQFVHKDRRTYYVHMVVAELFVSNILGCKNVEHLDGNILNNVASNLSWCADIPKYVSDKDLARPVRQYSRSGRLMREFDSLKDASRKLGVAQVAICMSCNRVHLPNGIDGCIYRFEDDDEMYNSGKEVAVRQYDLDGNFMMQFASVVDACVSTGLQAHEIQKCCQGSAVSYGGYRWCFGSSGVVSEFRFGRYKKSVRQYTPDGIFVAEFSSVTAARSELGFVFEDIGMCCARVSGYETVGNYIWRYACDDEFVGKHTVTVSQEFEVSNKPIRQYNLVGDLMAEYPSPLAAAAILKWDWQSIVRCCKRKIQRTNNYVWRFADDDEFAQGAQFPKLIGVTKRPVRQYGADGTFICEYPSAKEAEEETGILRSSIQACCRNRDGRKCGGFYWRYQETDELGGSSNA